MNSAFESATTPQGVCGNVAELPIVQTNHNNTSSAEFSGTQRHDAWLGLESSTPPDYYMTLRGPYAPCGGPIL